MNNILHKPSNVIKGSAFAFVMELDELISNFTNIYCNVYRQDDKTSLCKLSMNAETGYDVQITSIDSYSVKVLITDTVTSDANIGLYSAEIELVNSEPNKFRIEKFINIEETQIT